MRRLFLAFAIMLLVPVIGISGDGQVRVVPDGQLVAPTAGIKGMLVVQNDRARLTQVHFEPGHGEAPHTHPTDQFVIILTRGEVQITDGAQTTTGVREPGYTFYVPPMGRHGVVNVGKTPFELMVVGFR